MAKLCVYSLLSALESHLPASTKKRLRSVDLDDEDSIGPASKIRKLNTDLDATSNDYIYDTTNKENGSSLKEPIQKCLTNIFKIFGQCLITDSLTPKTYFIFQFFSTLIQCGGERIKPIVKFIPQGLIQNLLKIIPVDDLTVGLITQLYDLSTTPGRQSATSDLCLLRNIQIRNSSKVL